MSVDLVFGFCGDGDRFGVDGEIGRGVGDVVVGVVCVGDGACVDGVFADGATWCAGE